MWKYIWAKALSKLHKWSSEYNSDYLGKEQIRPISTVLPMPKINSESQDWYKIEVSSSQPTSSFAYRRIIDSDYNATTAWYNPRWTWHSWLKRSSWTESLNITLPSAVIVKKFVLWVRYETWLNIPGDLYAPSSIVFQGSNDWSNFVTIQSYWGMSNTANHKEEFSVSNTTPYKYYRFIFGNRNWIYSNNYYVALGYLQLYS